MCSSHVTTSVVASQLQAPMRAVANAIRRRSPSWRTISSSDATLGDVVRDGHRGDDLAGVVAYRRHARVHEHGRVVLAPRFVVAHPRLAARDGGLDGLVLVRRLRVEEVGDSASGCLGGRPPEEGLGTGVPRDAPARHGRAPSRRGRSRRARATGTDRSTSSDPPVRAQRNEVVRLRGSARGRHKGPPRSRDVGLKLSSRPARCLRRCRRDFSERSTRAAIAPGDDVVCDDGHWLSVTPCPITPCPITPCRITPCRITPCRITPCPLTRNRTSASPPSCSSARPRSVSRARGPCGIGFARPGPARCSPLPPIRCAAPPVTTSPFTSGSPARPRARRWSSTSATSASSATGVRCSPPRPSRAGIAGLVIDGCVRDVAALAAHEFPVFSTGLALPGATKNRAGAIGGSGVTVGDVDGRAR